MFIIFISFSNTSPKENIPVGEPKVYTAFVGMLSSTNNLYENICPAIAPKECPHTYNSSTSLPYTL